MKKVPLLPAGEEWQDWKETQAKEFELKPLTKNQAKYLEALEKATIICAHGPAGTGKSYMACCYGASLLRSGQVDKIIITRPLVTCGFGIGYLPGELDNKTLPYMRPMIDVLGECLGKSELKKCLNDGRIEPWALELMRGASIKKSIVICDEAQNAEYSQLHMLLTRIDKGTKIVVTGDIGQSDLDYDDNPLAEILFRFRKNCHKDISIVKLGPEDVCRPEIVRWVDERLR